MCETEALHRLLHLPKVNVRKLLAQYGSAEAALAKTASTATDSWEKDREALQKKGIKLLSYKDPFYPSSLRKLPDFPLLLYVKGELLQCDMQSLAIIGTRGCSLYGQEMAEQMASEIAAHGITVVSGLARGIDTAAHRGALKRGRTIAFIGSGFDHLYPRENEALAVEIAKRGVVISELPLHALPEKRHFPARNRLVSAFSRGAFLVEAPLKSGAMITMEMAHSQGKYCFALPGRADSESFRGNHFLIKQQKATLVEKGEEMVSILLPDQKISPQIGKSFIELSEQEQQLVLHFPQEEIGIESLAEKTQFSLGKLNALLMGLVLKRVIREFPGKRYKKG